MHETQSTLSFKDLFENISVSIMNRLQPKGGSLGKDGTLTVEPVTDGFMWIRMTWDQAVRLLERHSTTVNAKAVVVLFAPRTPLMIDMTTEVLIDGRTLSVKLNDDLSTDRCTVLAEKFNALHALHLIYDPEGTDQVYVVVECKGNDFRTGGWLPSKEAEKWANEGAQKDSGRTSDFGQAISLMDNYSHANNTHDYKEGNK
jgi:hypothetical protein